MRKLNFIKYAILCLFVVLSVHATAQVTIGSDNEPDPGALLDLKEEANYPQAGNTSTLKNSTKGVLFPKVKLVRYNDLAPLYTSPNEKTRLNATGMVVYNVNENADQLFTGFHYWDGSVWKEMIVGGSSGSEGSRFYFSCGEVSVRANLKKGQPTNPATDQITVNVTFSRPGSIYSIQTDKVNGVRFSASGRFTASGGRETIVLKADGGTPLNPGTFKYTFKTNSIETGLCEGVNITAADEDIPEVIKVVLLSNDQPNWGAWDISEIYSPYGPRSVRSLLENKKFFDTNDEAKVKIRNMDIKFYGRDQNGGSTNWESPGQVLNRLRNNDVDILIVGHEVAFSQEKENELIRLVKDGKGVLIYCTDVGGANALRKRNVSNILRGIFGTTFTVPNDGEKTVKLMELQDNPDVVNGPVYSLTGKSIGHDGEWNYDIPVGQVPEDADKLFYGAGGNVRGIKHRELGFIFIGDGGIFSGGDYQQAREEANFHPCLVSRIDGYYMPDIKTKGDYYNGGNGVYNAHFLTNILVWAVNYVIEHRR